MPAILDTHAWMWWANGDARLSRKAKTGIEQAQAKDELFLSMISIWEIAKKVEKKQVVLDRPLDDWLDAATMLAGLHVWELTRAILLESGRLPQPFHGDPADQMIVATARHHAATLITKDKKILDYPHVRTIW